ncbi:carboxymuconolactone decarboxylase family protein [Pseudohalocynthiibacter sp. F2068]|uniref:carboxymuconolactone decarboxylase family protein n=1 Tax=Pseudohalocynthiibacter sp. F2068 TaxID=2926418 RepID=UPI001FF509D5|nr:carboxymuconolactone decarboxylase family protein [Pseudohalocynthiibacter sp. F2068]MCK0104594.1 carboxymuconolactone decarboxylase family protein [Pseudohalocynthiibacter sp. F2068]
MPRLNAIDPATASGDAKELLDGIKKKIGMTPNLFKTMANAPAVLMAHLAFGDALSGGRFDAQAREAIALTVAGANSCEYCTSAHAAISKSLKVDGDEIERRYNGRSGDPKLDGALIFARQIVDKRGFVTNEDIANVRSAGHDDGAIVEIVANVATNLFTNYFNHVAETVVDFPAVEFEQSKAA